MLSRRALVGKLAAGVAGTAVALAAGGGRANAALARRGANGSEAVGQDKAPPASGAAPEVIDAALASTQSAQPPWELLRPLAASSVVANGWRVADLSDVVDGSCVLTLRNERGREYRVHLCRNDGHPHGLVHTQRLDLLVMNGGQGDLPTEEGFAQAVAELANVLAANEGDRWDQDLVTALLPHEERLRLFAGPVARRLR